MSTQKFDLQPKSQLWTNSADPVNILVGEGNTGNAVQAASTGTNKFNINMRDNYKVLPLMSEVSTFQFYTKRASNAGNKDWYLQLTL